MTVVCPTVTAFDTHDYRDQMERLQSFAKRVHIDLMDGRLAPHVSPSVKQLWWPETVQADVHLMYQRPMDELAQLVQIKPSLVVIHAEAEGDLAHMATHLRENGIKAGLALVQSVAVDDVKELLACFDHVMVYSGNLGEHGGHADLSLLEKVKQLKAEYPNLEISWDGGINDKNASQLVEAGVDVLNVGGFIANAEDPAAAYAKLKQ